MSLGRRIVQGGGVRALARFASPPREPLLFLYPSWIKQFSTHSSRAAGDSKTSTLPTQSTDNVHTSNGGIKYTNDTAPPATNAGKLGDNETKEGQRPSSDADSAEALNAKDNGMSTAAQNHNRDTSSRVESRAPEFRFREEDYSEPIFAKVLVHRLRDVNARAQIAKEHKYQMRKAHKEHQRKTAQSWEPDWRHVLSALCAHTPKDTKWHEKAVTITVPKADVPTLMNGVDTSMWKMAARYNCTITIAEKNPETHIYDSYYLSGSATAIKLTTLDLVRIAPSLKLTTTGNRFGPKTNESDATLLDDSGAGKARSIEAAEPGFTIRATANRIIPEIQVMRADKYPRPTSWTPRSFLDFAYELTNMNMPGPLHRMLYKGRETHVDAVSNVLRELFQEPDCFPVISREAFNVALVYFMKTRQLNDLRRFFMQMERMHIQPDVETFNIMLQGAAAQDDIHNFHYILHMMLRYYIVPNGATWLAFMAANRDIRIKLEILHEMRERRLLTHIRVIQGLCEQLAHFDAKTSLERDEGHEEFINRMDSRYGPKWLNLESGHQILHVLSSRGLISRCWEFMRFMESRSVLPESESVAIVLQSCQYTKNMNGAIEFMRDLPACIPPELDSNVYSHLFQLAMELKAFNVARVVWRYACLNAAMSGKMRHQVRQSLIAIGSNFRDARNARHRWMQQMGYFVLGHTGLDGQDFLLARYNEPDRYNEWDRSMDDVRSDDLAVQSFEPGDDLYLPDYPGSRESTHELSLDIDERLKEEFSVFENWEPAKPFVEMLEEAWNRDREWKDMVTDAWNTNDTFTQQEALRLPWRLERAISISVVHRWRPEKREWI
jgi:hypothetical protein